MNGRILLAALAAIVLIAAATPAMAQFGIGACSGVAYGPPQDCVATVSCNVPVTTQVPVPVMGTAYQPVTSLVPQVYTTPISSLPVGANAPGGLSKGLSKAPTGGLSKGLSKAAPSMPVNTGLGKGLGKGMGKGI